MKTPRIVLSLGNGAELYLSTAHENLNQKDMLNIYVYIYMNYISILHDIRPIYTIILY